VGDSFRPTLRDRRTGKVIFSDDAEQPQLDVAVRHDGAAVAFFTHATTDTFDLYVRDPRGRRRLGEGGGDSALRPIEFSGDGSKLLFSRTKGERAELLTIDVASEHETDLGAESLRSGATWLGVESAALVPAEDPTGIVIVAGGKRTALPVLPGGTVGDLAGSPEGGRIAVSVRPKGAEYFQLVVVDVGTEKVTACASSPSTDLTQPQWLDGTRLAVRSVGASTDTDLVGVCGALEPLDPGGGSLRVIGSASDGELTVIHSAPDHPSAVETRKAGDPASAPFSEDAGAYPHGASPEAITLPATEGPIPMLLWRARTERGALLVVHGGPHLPTSALAWDVGPAWLVDQGIDVLEVEYRGSGGYGATFEQVGSADEARRDVAAAYRYVKTELASSPKRVMVLGWSYGGALVAHAAAEGELGDAPLALVSSLTVQVRPPAKPSPARILAFHGGLDTIAPPLQTRAFLLRTFGADALSPPRGEWRLLPLETHSLHHTSSLVELYSAIAETILQP
jgi:hypothetical protein